MTACIAMPWWVEEAIARLHRGGFSAYIVGGCVRDSLLGKVPHDWDICTAASPEQVKRIFGAFHVIETGARHGTVTVVIDAHLLEITTFRTDGAYLDGRRPASVSFVSSLREDLSRRDFTINAMAYEGGHVIDYFGGMDDLRRAVVRCVGRAGRRFEEDALRMLRAVRFAACLGFSIDRDTREALCRMAPRIHLVAAERIREEVLRCLAGDDAPAHLDLLFLLLGEAQPAFSALQGRGAALKQAIGRLPADGFVRLQLLLWQLEEKDFACALAWLRLDRAQTRMAHALYAERAAALPACMPQIRRLLHRLGTEGGLMLLMLRCALGDEAVHALDMAREAVASGACCSVSALAVSGADLAALGMRGADIGTMLAHLLDAVMDETLPNEREILLGYARRHMIRF